MIPRVLGSALAQSRRSSFVKQYLYLLWPDANGLLLELARRLGDEIITPGEQVSLFAVCLRKGAENFHRRKGRYNPTTWNQNVFLLFFQGVFSYATKAYDCRVRTASGASWEITQLPYLDWRSRNPGTIEVCWLPESASKDRAGELCRMVLSGCNYRHTWTVRQLLGALEGDEDLVR